MFRNTVFGTQHLLNGSFGTHVLNRRFDTQLFLLEASGHMYLDRCVGTHSFWLADSRHTFFEQALRDASFLNRCFGTINILTTEEFLHLLVQQVQSRTEILNRFIGSNIFFARLPLRNTMSRNLCSKRLRSESAVQKRWVPLSWLTKTVLRGPCSKNKVPKHLRKKMCPEAQTPTFVPNRIPKHVANRTCATQLLLKHMMTPQHKKITFREHYSKTMSPVFLFKWPVCRTPAKSCVSRNICSKRSRSHGTSQKSRVSILCALSEQNWLRLNTNRSEP
jgi:hypothetical protein